MGLESRWPGGVQKCILLESYRLHLKRLRQYQRRIQRCLGGTLRANGMCKCGGTNWWAGGAPHRPRSSIHNILKNLDHLFLFDIHFLRSSSPFVVVEDSVELAELGHAALSKVVECQWRLTLPR